MTAPESTIRDSVTSIFGNYGPSVLNALIIVFTVSGQTLLKKLSFSCPCVYPLNVLHAGSFLFSPAIALFIFGVIINQNTWKIIHGCLFRARKHQCRTVIIYWTSILSQALIAPIAWLFVAFLDGSYYQCLQAATFCSNSTKCENYTNPWLQSVWNSEMKCDDCICNMTESNSKRVLSESQLIAWTLLLLAGFISMSAICLVRSFDKYTHVQNTYVSIYRSEERTVFELEAREHARRVAEKNCRKFFAQEKWTKADWDSVSTVPSVHNSYLWDSDMAEKTDPLQCTPLQEWTNKEQA